MGMTKLEKARRASGITLESACSMLGITIPTLLKYQQDPGLMPFGQFFALAAKMDPDAKAIMAGVPEEVRESASEMRPIEDMTMGEFFRRFDGTERLKAELADGLREAFD